MKYLLVLFLFLGGCMSDPDSRMVIETHEGRSEVRPLIEYDF